MQTKIIMQSQINKDKEVLTPVYTALKEGELVVIPTETVYGLAANGLDEKAIKKIFEAKGRPQDNPLILHISNINMWGDIVVEIPYKAKALADAFWPGPLTIILNKKPIVPFSASGGLSTVAVRMPSHRIALSIIEGSGVPLAAPSANISGKPSPTELNHCIKDMSGKVSYIIDGGDCAFGVESTVINMVGEIPTILRPGAVTKEEISAVIGEVHIDSAVTEKLLEDIRPTSPGMKYTHYSPQSPVYIIKGTLEAFSEYVNNIEDKSLYALVFEGEEQYIHHSTLSFGEKDDSYTQAHSLFSALRELDNPKVSCIYARCPSLDGIGLAVYNRLIRAAGFRIIDLEV